MLRIVFAFLLPFWTCFSAERPNFLVVFTDDQGWNDVGCFGSEIPTPHIDSLARDGMKFERFYAASSICTPSRFGLLTGRNPSRSKSRLLQALMFLGDYDKGRGIQPGETTLPTVLRKAAYDTALIGKWHLGHGKKTFWANRHGFDLFHGHTAGCIDFFTLRYGERPDWYRNDELLQESGYATDIITNAALSFLQGHAKTKKQKEEKNFFLFLPYNAPHFGKAWDEGAQSPVNVMQPPPEYLPRVAKLSADPIRRAFAAKVMNLDDNFGRILGALDKFGLRENTLVLFLTDHGGVYKHGGSNKPLRGEKATLYEGGLRVPCLLRWPGKVKAGSVLPEVCSALDLFPTFARLAGASTEGLVLDGIDLSTALLGGQASPAERELFWQTGAHAELARDEWLALRSGDWKLVQEPGKPARLFNLRQDPNETRDLAQSEKPTLEGLLKRAQEKKAEYARFAKGL